MPFPSPIGGIPFRSDLAPSIIFAIAYAALIPLFIRRIFNHTWNTITIGTIIFVIERIVIFSLRATQAVNESRRSSSGLALYMQVTIGLGFISPAIDFINLFRCLLVNATKGDENAGKADRPDERRIFRRFTDFYSLAYLAAVVPGAIGGGKYSKAMKDAAAASELRSLRYVSASVALFLMIVFACCCLASLRVKNIERKPVFVLFYLTLLLIIVPIYRLSVLHNTTTSLTSLEPGSLSSPADKTLFYIFHMVPEYIAAAFLLGTNLRDRFKTGRFGDWQSSDRQLPHRKNSSQSSPSAP